MSEMGNWKAAQACAAGFTQNWNGNEPGGAVIGFDAHGIRFAEAGGVESLSTLAPFTAASVVRYASVTKHAFCAMVLAHSDKIGLDDPLGQHLPELQAPLRDVTVGRALDMSGGLPDTRECLSLLGLSVYTETKAGLLLDFLARQTRLNYEAGTEISYSNTGYRLVEAALERQGVFFRDYVRELGAQAGAVLDAPDVWNDPVIGLVPGYWLDGQRWQLSAAGLHISASGSMTGSGESLAKWLIGLLDGKGSFDGILEQLSAARPLADGRMSGYGLGLRQSPLGSRSFIGHGGSHPGYKSYFLLDPTQKTGFVVVSNREDTNGYKIALESMAALTGEALPRPSSALRDGTYVTESGPWWIKVAGSTVTYLDADETVYEDEGSWVSSRSPSSPMHLTMQGEDIVGEVGHAKRRFLPVKEQDVPGSLSGVWNSSEGARFEIENGSVIMGIGPVRHSMPLRALGNGRFLFTLVDGPWTKRVCLNLLGADRLELVLARARMIEYRRAG
ncbi:serine hydrolase domain-containing protein [Rhizobium miluonense]|uniref:CubicO group peptidase, beta-lactamase class C family n=1 Tax=Rhizobium miluonense TaxID=411945 RepID=A0A1C3UEJ9_9HYPH|nr:serine hydrolase domain-containing protein [Rhizobium miluonense]SCB13777.1 CubicO group peptidase, beta-lactamase class C family [Rhizobium miluonense]